MKLVTSDMKASAERDEASGSAMQMSQLMLLTCARVTAGVLEPEDCAPVTEAGKRMLGEDLFANLERLWTAAQAHRDDTDWAPLKNLAEEWIRLLNEAGFKTEPPTTPGNGGIPIPIDELADALGVTVGELMDQLDEMAEEAEINARTEAGDQAESEEDERRAAAANARDEEKDEAEKEATKVFGKSTADLPNSRSDSRLIEERKPKDSERAAAVTVARMLEKAKYQDRVVVKKASVAPPGRLRARAMVQGAAEEARGAIKTAEPWSRKRRFHTQDPELKLGMMTDISGSMSSAMLPMAAANWIFSEAGRRIQAKVASVYFGNSVFPGLRPGEHLTNVKVYSAVDGTERFDKAFKALNGKLDLLNSTGARLLVVVSDLHHTPAEREAEAMWFKRCADEGVAVLIIPFSAGGYYIGRTVGDLPVRVLDHVHDPVTAALEIGHAAADALTQAGRRG